MEPCLCQSGIFESLADVPRALAGHATSPKETDA